MELQAKGLQGLPNAPHVGDNIYVIRKGARVLPKPFLFNKIDSIDPFIDYSAGASKPLLSRDGNQIYFSALTAKGNRKFAEGSQFYQYSEDRKHRRITNITPSTNIFSATLSPGGNFLIVVMFDAAMKSRVIGICNIKEGANRKINLPDQVSQIIKP